MYDYEVHTLHSNHRYIPMERYFHFGANLEFI